MASNTDDRFLKLFRAYDDFRRDLHLIDPILNRRFLSLLWEVEDALERSGKYAKKNEEVERQEGLSQYGCE
jgi:hypothetical protein